MKALSVKQPWANMIAYGKRQIKTKLGKQPPNIAKSIETRTWKTSYRGELLIVSSKTKMKDDIIICCYTCSSRTPGFAGVDKKEYYCDSFEDVNTECPGRIINDVYNLPYWCPIREVQPRLNPYYGYALAVVNLVDCRKMTIEDEVAACCEVYPGAYAWVLEDIKPIAPFPVKGQLRLFEVDYEV